MSGFVDFADVKARCSIEQAAKLLGLQCTERAQLRALCLACGNGGPRAIVITPAKNLFHCFSSKAGGDQIALVSHVKGVSQRTQRPCCSANRRQVLYGQQVPYRLPVLVPYKTTFPRSITWSSTTSLWRPWGLTLRPPKRSGLAMPVAG
jgi:hypothetical protein